MKPLIVSFFAVILFYSVFVDDEKEAKSDVRQTTYTIRAHVTDTTLETDTAMLFAKKRLIPASPVYMDNLNK